MNQGSQYFARTQARHFSGHVPSEPEAREGYNTHSFFSFPFVPNL